MGAIYGITYSVNSSHALTVNLDYEGISSFSTLNFILNDSSGNYLDAVYGDATSVVFYNVSDGDYLINIHAVYYDYSSGTDLTDNRYNLPVTVDSSSSEDSGGDDSGGGSTDDDVTIDSKVSFSASASGFDVTLTVTCDTNYYTFNYAHYMIAASGATQYEDYSYNCYSESCTLTVSSIGTYTCIVNAYCTNISTGLEENTTQTCTIDVSGGSSGGDTEVITCDYSVSGSSIQVYLSTIQTSRYTFYNTSSTIIKLLDSNQNSLGSSYTSYGSTYASFTAPSPGEYYISYTAYYYDRNTGANGTNSGISNVITISAVGSLDTYIQDGTFYCDLTIPSSMSLSSCMWTFYDHGSTYTTTTYSTSYSRSLTSSGTYYVVCVWNSTSGYSESITSEALVYGSVSYFYWSDNARYAMENKGAVSEASYTEWNALCATLSLALNGQGYDYVPNSSYGSLTLPSSTSGTVLMTSSDKEMTANRFNSILYNIKRLAGSRVSQPSTVYYVSKGDICYGSLFIGLETYLNNTIAYYYNN